MHLSRLLPVMTAIVALAALSPRAAQQTTGAAASSAHQHDAAAQHAMGFDPHKTTHHFYLYEDGGAIDVSVNDKADTTNRDAIRMHLSHIAMMFGEGQFDAPMMTHETTSMPGIADLAKLKDKIKYAYTETPVGGRVDITTTDKAALAAAHAFLKYQIKEHETGDKTNVTKRK